MDVCHSDADPSYGDEGEDGSERLHIDTVVCGDGISKSSVGKMVRGQMYATDNGGRAVQKYWPIIWDDSTVCVRVPRIMNLSSTQLTLTVKKRFRK